MNQIKIHRKSRPRASTIMARPRTTSRSENMVNPLNAADRIITPAIMVPAARARNRTVGTSSTTTPTRVRGIARRMKRTSSATFGLRTVPTMGGLSAGSSSSEICSSSSWT